MANSNGRRLDLKTLGALATLTIAVVSAVAVVASAFYFTREEAVVHVSEFDKHVTVFEVHAERAENQSDLMREMRLEQKEQRALLQNMRENQIRSMERWRVQPAPMPRRGTPQ